MATLTLNRVWLHDASNLGVFVTLKVRNIVGTPDRNARLDEFASGRTRVVSTPIRRTVVQFDALLVPRGDVDRLESWIGQLLLYRDPRQRKLFGFLSELPTSERIYVETADLPGLRFTATTDTEEV